MLMFKKILILFFCMGFFASLYATHDRAGEITYEHVSGLTYEFTITTYTYTPSPADRPEIEVFWGDGSSSIIERHTKVSVGEDISQNVYYATHTFPSIGNYMITYEDENRNAGIVNIPNSVQMPFFIQTQLVINPFLGGNSSPDLLNMPIDNGCVNVPFMHNPGAVDPDGDSLSYQLVSCMGFDGEVIPGYTMPAASHSISIDPVTGDLIWDSPMLVGEYNIAIQISEWRQGILIGSIVRDMQISIVACDNVPPEIVTIEDTCVLAGTTLAFDVIVTDSNSSQVSLTATGDPFLLSVSPAVLSGNNGAPPDTFRLTWHTQCAHVKQGNYTLYFKAKDNGPVVELTTFKTLNIKVVAPRPENPELLPIGNTIQFSWNREVCDNAVGYDVYRRVQSYDFVPDNCETGLPEYTGYQWIGSTASVDDTVFVDDGSVLPLLHGNEYCYRVVARFPDGAESYASEEVCAFLMNDAPLMTHADVLFTHADTGSIFVSWTPPTELDSVAFPGPNFEYHIYRNSSEDSEYQLIASTNSFYDTAYTDVELATDSLFYRYKVELWGETATGMQKVENSDAAATLFLEVSPRDRAVDLHWNVQVPWHNTEYTIYRSLPGETEFDSIAVTADNFYTDYNLTNGERYRYYVRSEGAYYVPDTLAPLFNRSQMVEVIPEDKTPPEIPLLAIETDCESVTFSWSFSSDSAYTDVYRYYIYYKPNYDSPYQLIDSLEAFDDSCYPSPCQYVITKENVVGCYTMMAVDSNGNQSAFAEEVCLDIDECFSYTLPNIFTPNGDNINDLYQPFPYQGVEEVEFYVYNRWGRLVFHTTEPNLDWDGKDWKTGEPLPEGNYYYACDVILQSLDGEEKRPLHGTIILLRNKTE